MDPEFGSDRPFLLSPDDLLELDQNFAPFVRHDEYGPTGRGDLPLSEKFLLAAAMATLVAIRVTVGSAILIVSYLICGFCGGITDSDGDDEQEGYVYMEGWRRFMVVDVGRFLARVMLFTIGFYWIDESHRIPYDEYEGIDKNECREQSEEFERPGAIVSNHVSYADVLYYLSSYFPSFIAKRSVAELPIVGLISKCLGCVYVQREAKLSECKGVSGIVTKRVLAARQNRLAPVMVLFPGLPSNSASLSVCKLYGSDPLACLLPLRARKRRS